MRSIPTNLAAAVLLAISAGCDVEMPPEARAPGSPLAQASGAVEIVSPTGLLAAVEICRRSKLPPEQALATKSNAIDEGWVVYLFEPAEVIGGDGSRLELMMADGGVAHLRGAQADRPMSGKTVIPGLVHVSRVVRYTTVLGANAVAWQLELLGESDWARAEAELVALDNQRKQDLASEQLAKLQAKPERIETFTSADGRFETEATVIGFADGKVGLRKSDGQEIDVELTRLDQESQDRIKRRLVELAQHDAGVRRAKKTLGIE